MGAVGQAEATVRTGEGQGEGGVVRMAGVVVVGVAEEEAVVAGVGGEGDAYTSSRLLLGSPSGTPLILTDAWRLCCGYVRVDCV